MANRHVSDTEPSSTRHLYVNKYCGKIGIRCQNNAKTNEALEDCVVNPQNYSLHINFDAL